MIVTGASLDIESALFRFVMKLGCRSIDIP